MDGMEAVPSQGTAECVKLRIRSDGYVELDDAKKAEARRQEHLARMSHQFDIGAKYVPGEMVCASDSDIRSILSVDLPMVVSETAARKDLCANYSGVREETKSIMGGLLKGLQGMVASLDTKGMECAEGASGLDAIGGKLVGCATTAICLGVLAMLLLVAVCSAGGRAIEGMGASEPAFQLPVKDLLQHVEKGLRICEVVWEGVAITDDSSKRIHVRELSKRNAIISAAFRDFPALLGKFAEEVGIAKEEVSQGKTKEFLERVRVFGLSCEGSRPLWGLVGVGGACIFVAFDSATTNGDVYVTLLHELIHAMLRRMAQISPGWLSPRKHPGLRVRIGEVGAMVAMEAGWFFELVVLARLISRDRCCPYSLVSPPEEFR
jgi:hypothetical protein